MKRISLLLFTIAIIFSLSAFNSEPNTYNATKYEQGFKEGFSEGWKDVRGQYSIPPVAPVAPVPEVGKNTYNGGYNKGFKIGTKRAKK